MYHYIREKREKMEMWKWRLELKKIIESLTYEKWMFVRLMILVTIPLAVMGIVSYTIYIRAESEKTQITLNSYSDEISREYENILSSLREYYIELANSETIRWLERQEEAPYSSYSDLKQAQRVLEGNYFMAKYIDRFEFINLNHGWVFNDYGLFPYESIQNREETEEFLKEQRENPLAVYWMNRMNAEKPLIRGIRMSNTVDSSGMMLVVKRDKGIGDLACVLTVCLDEQALVSLSDNYKKLGYDIAILGNGEVFMETDEEMTQGYLDSLEQEKNDGIIKTSSGKRYSIHARTGGSSGLTYVIAYDASRVSKDASVFLVAAFGVVAGFALLLILVRVTAMAFAEPLRKLEQFVDDQNIRIKELLVSNMIKGELNGEKIAEALKKSEIVPCAVYRMIAMNCKESGMSEAEQRERYGKILAELPESLRQKVFITPIIYRDKLVFLTGADKDMEIDIVTAELYKELKDYIAENFHCVIASGISQSFHKLHHVGRAYSECAEALYNKSNQEDPDNSSLVLFDDYMAVKQGNNVYDMIMETELIQAVHSCNKEEAGRLTEIIIGRMESKGVVGIERSLYVSRLLAAILNIPASVGISLSDVFDSEQYNMMSHITQIYEKKKVIMAITGEIIGPIIRKLEDKKQQGEGSEIVRELMILLKESRGNISLNECAEKLNYHPNYLSKVLKKEKGITFTDMVNEEKLKLAKYMLLTTEYSIAEIADRLQYNNVQNFIRFFKNHVEVTPAAFRREHVK